MADAATTAINATITIATLAYIAYVLYNKLDPQHKLISLITAVKYEIEERRKKEK